ncbi:MAG: restriction endonuclease subunit S [Microcystis sp. M113S1]|uniref:restriction endonuclease subunit S n=1 Tax=Microcystis sp. M113S1 TaxID=2771104 RepID=UPI002583D0CA|nr:restriction endonuclease subunit S [Microcystis sp. M113S1]MCA2939772.1 restriction endonuclease subunit S [Microcystis sp. M113S1]
MKVAGIVIELPKTWQWANCSEVIDVRDGTHETPKYVSEGYPLVTSKNLKPDGIDFSTISYISEKDHLEISKRSRVDRNDILFAMIGTIGNPVLVDIDTEFSIKNVALFKFANSPIDPRYFRYLLKTRIIERQLDFEERGGTQKFVSLKVLRNMKIPYPPLEEQRRIAAILDKADGVRRKRKEAIRLTEELLKSTFLEMFGDPVTNPKGWEIKKLEEVTTKITDGVHSRPNYTEQGVPFISVKDITTGELKFDDCKFISEEDHKKYKKRCNPDMGDILYTKVGATYGRPALVNVKSEFSLYVSVCLIKPQRDLIFPEFLKEALATPALKSQADRSIKGIGVPDLHLNMIKDFIVPVPPIYKQKEFLEIASKIQFSKESLTSCSQESENLFNSLLQRAFRGEL